jgi:hypothetical protein
MKSCTAGSIKKSDRKGPWLAVPERGPRRSWLGALVLLCAAGLLGCGDNQDPVGAQALYDRIQELDYRNTFAPAPGFETRQPSNTAHSDFSAIYINETVANVLEAAEPLTEWPLDSLIIKDGSDSGGTVDLIAVMEKRSDGWYWAEYLDPSEPDGGVKYSGKPDVCIDCHRGSGQGDFTIGVQLPR